MVLVIRRLIRRYYTHRFWHELLAWWCACLLISMLTRAYFFHDELSLFPARLLLSELLMSGLPALLFSLTPRGFLRGIFVFFWCFLTIGNVEHIRDNSGNMSLTLIHYALDKTFVSGSVLTPSVIYQTLICFVLIHVFYILLGFVLRDYRTTLKKHTAFFCVATSLVLIIVLSIYPISEEHPVWQQMSPLEENVRTIALSVNRVPEYFESTNLPESLYRFYTKDLSGTLIDSHQSLNNPNILVLFVESLNDDIVKGGWMPNLAYLKSQGLSFDQYIVNSTTTNNGIYATFCGDYPEIFFSNYHNVARNVTDKNDEKKWQCLPQILADRGYDSTFIEAVNVNFAHKNKILNEAGFKTLIDDADFALQDRTSWGNGATDEALYEKIYDIITQQNNRKNPWLISALNVSTHPPGFIADHQYSDVTNRMERTYRVMDVLIWDLLSKLNDDGVLKNTIVVVTGDESRVQRVLKKDFGSIYSSNNGFMLILTPNNMVHQNSGPFLQSDFKLSMLDYLQLDHTAAMGRSLFREYPSPSRQYYFGFNHTNKLYISLGNKQMLHCNREFECMKQTNNDWNIFKQKNFSLSPSFYSEMARDLIFYNDHQVPYHAIPSSLTD